MQAGAKRIKNISIKEIFFIPLFVVFSSFDCMQNPL